VRATSYAAKKWSPPCQQSAEAKHVSFVGLAQAKILSKVFLLPKDAKILSKEAALCVARSPEGRAEAAKRAAAAAMTSEATSRQAQAEGLTVLVADNKSGYFGLSLTKPGQPKPYQAGVWRGGKKVSLGHFATAGEAALCVARSPEGRAEAAKRAAAAATLTSEVVSSRRRRRSGSRLATV